MLTRISSCCTAWDAELEEARENLRDRRWARRRSMIGVAGRWIAFGGVLMGFELHFGPVLLIRATSLI
jgi:hypothetical protein